MLLRDIPITREKQAFLAIKTEVCSEDGKKEGKERKGKGK